MNPLWALGPGRFGQRYTPKDGTTEAIYMSEDMITAIAEYHQIHRHVLVHDRRYRPMPAAWTQFSIDVQLERVLDITDTNIQKTLDTSEEELISPWKGKMIKGEYVPTQSLGSAVFKNEKIQGMRFPSARGPKYANLIVWNKYVCDPFFIVVNDDKGNEWARIP